MSKRFLALVPATVVSFVLMGGTAFATDPPTPAEVVGEAAGEVAANLTDVVGAVLPYAAILIALTFGWRLARRFLRA